MTVHEREVSHSERKGLAGLDRVALPGLVQQRFEYWLQWSGGSPAFQARKKAEARDLLAMSHVAPGRLEVLEMDFSQALRAALRLRVPVPCRPKVDGPLDVAQEALLGLVYREESFRQPTPGFAFIQVLAPRHCWHANISHDAVQALCLGQQLPAGIRVKDLVLMAYGALSMQTVQFNELDPAGVMNKEAALWWQLNPVPTPLSKEPFCPS